MDLFSADTSAVYGVYNWLYDEVAFMDNIYVLRTKKTPDL